MAFCELRYRSDALGKQTAALVLLPETGAPPYPTLYLLHGLSDDHTIWHRHTSIERYHARLALPLIIVMPDGGRGFYGDGVASDAHESAITTDLVARIDRTFPTRAERSGRATAGLSMGGYGALRLALRRSDLFCAAASHSGAVHFGHKPIGWDGKPYPPFLQRILGETLPNPDFDLHALVRDCPKETRPALYIDCGTEDFLLAENRAFHQHLVAQSEAHIYIEHPGAHSWEYWDAHIGDSLHFVGRQMTPPAPILSPEVPAPDSGAEDDAAISITGAGT